MNSKWQANRIGLINFWYYDDQEFSFAKGRMLLRGSNGSGKSVTMQSVIPLLLDGNMSPERLDPFGSRDRKMSSYLLEEGDEREERTGYLYLEFRRRETDTYMTIGMGIRARKGKPLDKWYFGLSDNRRVGRDFFLYKEAGDKVTLSKKELENRIGEGGVVFDRQQDYMSYVNRQIFGFETADEYKEMIDLLIQLRTPKLSKDFKPSVVNEILSDSLQPLSDEELLPMSEAIENMDTQNMNLKARQEARTAAEKINRVLDRYNRLILYEKAENYVSGQKQAETLKTEIHVLEASRVQALERGAALEEEREALDAQKDAMEKERTSLNQSDAVNLKERQMELLGRIQAHEQTCREKERQLASKQEQVMSIENRKKSENDRLFVKEQEISALLAEMDEEANAMAFEEHTFFSDELLKDLSSPYVYDTHQMQMENTRDKITQGLEILREEDLWRRQADEQRKKRDKHQREEDSAMRQVNLQGDIFVQIQNEWAESLYGWAGKNEELVLSDETLKSMAAFVQNYGAGSDYGQVREAAADAWLAAKGRLDTALQQKSEEVRHLLEEKEGLEAELVSWENMREPEPERSPQVQKNRKRLQDMGIPYDEFYKVLEFGSTLSKKECDDLEEALMHMGILDALVIDESYKAQVLKMDPGACDRYLFVSHDHPEISLLDVLDLNDNVNDIFSNQRITGILSGIAYGADAGTVVYKDGTYQIGVITGTVSGTHEAGFLGTRAREANRQAKIAACKAAINALDQELGHLKGDVLLLEHRLEKARKEYQAFPSDEDLREAWRMLSQAEQRLEQLKTEGLRLEDELRETGVKLGQIHKEALAVAGSLYLTCSLDIFQAADTAARDYSQHFYRLKSAHEVYLQAVAYLKEFDERLEDLDQDMDQIRYDLGNTKRALKNDQAACDSVTEQLKLTGYEQIRQRLDMCIQWLLEYPEKLRACVEERTRMAEQARRADEQLEEKEKKLQESEQRCRWLEKVYRAELELGYVTPIRDMAAVPSDRPDASLSDESQYVYDIKPQDVIGLLASECRNMQKDGIIGNLNQVLFENRSFLSGEQPAQTELFAQLDEEAPAGCPSARRTDIVPKYQGTAVPFYKLIMYLDDEIQQLTQLLKEGDRELFEDVLANTISRKIRGRINGSMTWVEKMNTLMGAMNTSSGLKLSLRWRSKTAESENQLDTRELVELLKQDYRLMQEEDAARLSLHFRSKVADARRRAAEGAGQVSFYQVMKDTLDYRKWFEFQLFYQKSGERTKELTNSVFGTFSGGEKAMAMYVPLFSAVVAKYQSGRKDAPRLISLDEAFAGVDNKNIRDMFRLMTEFGFDFIINSQVLWGDCDTLDALAIYQLVRPQNARFVTVMPYLWNGIKKEMMEDEYEMERRCSGK